MRKAPFDKKSEQLFSDYGSIPQFGLKTRALKSWHDAKLKNSKIAA